MDADVVEEGREEEEGGGASRLSGKTMHLMRCDVYVSLH